MDSRCFDSETPAFLSIPAPLVTPIFQRLVNLRLPPRADLSAEIAYRAHRSLWVFPDCPSVIYDPQLALVRRRNQRLLFTFPA